MLDARLVKIDAELQVITAEFDILANHVRLCRALGGGWDMAWTATPGENSENSLLH